jgi:hypothetical protein
MEMFRQRREEKIVKAKINLVRGVVFLLILVLYTGNALATASFETDYLPNGLFFSYNAGNGQRSVFINYTGNISQPVGDPLAAAGNKLVWNAGDGVQYKFTATGATSVGVATTGTNAVSVVNSSYADLLTGLSTAFSLDVSNWNGTTGTGTISWNPVTNLALTDAGTTLSSPTLNAFDLGSNASLTMSFVITSGVYNFVTGSSLDNIGTQLKAQLGQVTAAPEPGEWTLMLVGMGLIGFTIYRKKYQVALPEWQNVRKS